MTHDLTKGKITPLLIQFTLPLVFGNLFQLTYNAVDSIIVGQYVGTDALAAVGTATPIVNLAILFISGMCMGASILISAQYGAKQFDVLKRQISTTMLGGLGFSLAFAVICILLLHPILLLLQVPKAILPMTASFLRIMFLGLGFTFLYNFLANTMRALGDSRTPLIFLMISAVLNVVGDLLLVVCLGFGVAGSAVSTVCSEALCCLCCILYIQKKIPFLRLGRKWFVFDPGLLKQTVHYGMTSALQQTCLQIGKIIIQLFVNPMGVNVIAAFNVVNRIDDFAYTPEQNIGHAMTTLLAQNRGAQKNDRIRKGFFSGLFIEFCYSVFLFFLIYFGAPHLVSLFVQKGQTEVVRLGTQYLQLIAVMYILPAFTNGLQGYFRGMGDLKVTLWSTFMNMAGRVAAAYLLAPRFGMAGFAFANLAGWVLMLICEIPLLVHSIRQFGS